MAPTIFIRLLCELLQIDYLYLRPELLLIDLDYLENTGNFPLMFSEQRMHKICFKLKICYY